MRMMMYDVECHPTLACFMYELGNGYRVEIRERAGSTVCNYATFTADQYDDACGSYQRTVEGLTRRAEREAEERKRAGKLYDRARLDYRRAINRIRSGGDSEHRAEQAGKARKAADRLHSLANDYPGVFDSNATIEAAGTIGEAEREGIEAQRINLEGIARDLDKIHRAEVAVRPY